MHGCCGCVGSSLKPKLALTVDWPLNLKNLRVQIAPTGNRGIIFESFWITSNCAVEISTFQPQGSISSISTPMPDPHRAESSNASTEFVNQGFLLWNQSRKQWIGTRKRNNQVQQLREPKLSWNATYDSLLGSNKPFPKPIPLAEMVDFLVDIWEQEGVYG